MRKMFGSTLLAGVLLVLVAVAAGTVGASGNSGDVKVDGTFVDSIPNNAPHQRCQISIEFYNFDVGSPDATYALRLVEPTPSPGNNLLASGSVAVGGGPLQGFDKLNALVVVDLADALNTSGATPTDQGFHVRLDVMTSETNGEGAKSKVVWVSGDCGPAAA